MGSRCCPDPCREAGIGETRHAKSLAPTHKVDRLERPEKALLAIEVILLVDSMLQGRESVRHATPIAAHLL
jgi:hypothetical protein